MPSRSQRRAASTNTPALGHSNCFRWRENVDCLTQPRPNPRQEIRITQRLSFSNVAIIILHIWSFLKNIATFFLGMQRTKSCVCIWRVSWFAAQSKSRQYQTLFEVVTRGFGRNATASLGMGVGPNRSSLWGLFAPNIFVSCPVVPPNNHLLDTSGSHSAISLVAKKSHLRNCTNVSFLKLILTWFLGLN